MREGFGVPSIEQELMDFVCREFRLIFKGDMELKRSQYARHMMGWFELEYNYKPRDYKIIFESQMGMFSIRIYDPEGASVAVEQVLPGRIEAESKEENISKAIQLLSELLKQEAIPFLVSKNNKLYKKVNGVLIEIKNPYCLANKGEGDR